MAHAQMGNGSRHEHAGEKSTTAQAGRERGIPPSGAGRARVQEVLDRFARGFTSGDGEAAAELWQTPAFVMGAGMARAVSGRDEVAAFFGSAKDQYNSRGISGTRAEIQRLDWISDDLVVVDVRWPYLTAAGEEQGEERSTYTLMADDDGALKIRCVLMRGAAE